MQRRSVARTFHTTQRKKWFFQSLFQSCQGVRVEDIVRQWVPDGWCSDRESTVGKNCSSSRNGQPRCVDWLQWLRWDVWYEPDSVTRKSISLSDLNFRSVAVLQMDRHDWWDIWVFSGQMKNYARLVTGLWWQGLWKAGSEGHLTPPPKKKKIQS